MKLENIEVSPKQPNFISALKELEKIKIKTFACFTYGQVSFTLFEKNWTFLYIELVEEEVLLRDGKTKKSCGYIYVKGIKLFYRHLIRIPLTRLI